MSLINRNRSWASAIREADRGQWSDNLSTLLKSNADALKKLRGYAGHKGICSFMIGGPPCNCGLDALLKEIGGE